MDDPRPKGPTARPFVPDSRDIESLRRAAAVCKGCDSYKDATRTVFGRGAAPAAIVLIGEQPGDPNAARALMGSTFRITQSRGQLLQSPWGNAVIAAWHPSAVLRSYDEPDQASRMFDELAGDLRLAARHAKKR